LIVFFGVSAGAAAHAQQQYGDPTTFPGTYFTHRPAPLQVVDVTYFVGSGFSNPERSIITQAATIWNNSSLGGQVRLVEVTSPGDINFSSVDLNDVTTNLATRTLTSIPGAGLYPDGTPWRQITSVSIQIDSDPPGPAPYFTGGGSPAGRYNYLSLMLREFGIGLGLGFATSDPLSVMDSNLTPGEQHLTLSPADVAALNTLYGTPEPATWALFGVGLLALVALRKRS
jgi:hypothetical protein